MNQVTTSAVRLSKFSSHGPLLSEEITLGLRIIALHARVYTASREAYVKARKRCYRSNGPKADECDRLYLTSQEHHDTLRKAIDDLSESLKGGISAGILFTLAADRAIHAKGLANEIAEYLASWASDGNDAEFATYPHFSRPHVGQPVIQFAPDFYFRMRGTLVDVKGKTAHVRHLDQGYVFKTPVERLREVPRGVFAGWLHAREYKAAVRAEVLAILNVE